MSSCRSRRSPNCVTGPGVFGSRQVILLNPDDIAAVGLGAARHVDVTSHFDGQERTAEHLQVVPYPIARQSAAMYYPEANVLVPVTSVADQSNTPTSKSIRIALTPSAN